jgi:hypothetical protein
MAVISFCCERMSRVLISSTNRTPLLALWIAPGSTRSWLGVSIPPDWNGSWRTSPSSAPAWAPVASSNGAVLVSALFTMRFGIIESLPREP